MYAPENIIDLAMEKIYRHSYCQVEDKFLNELIDKIRDHEYYGKYELLVSNDGIFNKLELIGKPIYSY